MAINESGVGTNWRFSHWPFSETVQNTTKVANITNRNSNTRFRISLSKFERSRSNFKVKILKFGLTLKFDIDHAKVRQEGDV